MTIVVQTTITHPLGKAAINRLKSPQEASQIMDFFGQIALRQKFINEGKILNRQIVSADNSMIIRYTYRDQASHDEFIGHPVMVNIDQQLTNAGYTQTSVFV